MFAKTLVNIHQIKGAQIGLGSQDLKTFASGPELRLRDPLVTTTAVAVFLRVFGALVGVEHQALNVNRV